MKSFTLPLAAVLALTGFATAKEKEAKASGEDYKPEEVIKKFDKNSDNKLDLAEFSSMKKFNKSADPAAAAKKAFEEADANKDGSVTAEELKAVHDAKVRAGETKKPEAKKPEAKTDTKPEPAKPGAKPETPKPEAK